MKRKDWKQSRREQAAAVMEAEQRSYLPKLGIFNRTKRGIKRAFFMVVLLLVLVAIIIACWKMAMADEPAIKEGSFVEQMKDLSSLATSQAFVKVILEKEDNEIFGKEISTDIPGTKRKILLVVPGSVTAGVNLEEIESDRIAVDEEKKEISLKLPHAEILQEPSIDFDQVETYSISGLFRGDVDWEEGYQLANEAKEEIKKEAGSQGLLEKAEANAEKTIKEFYSQLGYSVKIEYTEG
ncbi:DUF4230 domain-containing protein [Niallia sp. Man26]|uniref:DUF4230 domain-containing protein n=1 Tax=Niallia sp. Man26 TaxID=2912824 RepID=UPI001EDBF376|nr:DUF4230 domain-containing protein [Niallia sp. Man26]UPO87509.1 DUF4230 domain-containing protein [Niallia sp. Man26]